MGSTSFLKKIWGGWVVARKQLRNFRTLAVRYGQFNTIRKWSCEDREGRLIPWYTYPAIEYLDHLDLSRCSVFEFGSGNSSCYWAERTSKVVSVEHDQAWYEKVSKVAQGRIPAQYLLLKDMNEYVAAIDRYPGPFNVIIIDGIWRGECARNVVKYIKKWGGDILIFDNSDWYPRTMAFLRSSLDWIPVDFHGFGPINSYTWTTSMFFNKESKRTLVYKNNLQSWGCLKQTAKDDL